MIRHGLGFAPAHHGEILQGVFDHGGVLHRALVTLPAPGNGSSATFVPGSGPGIGCSTALDKVRRAAELAMTEFSSDASPPVGGHVDISSSVPCGVGMGSSTADVVATIRAVADYHGVTPAAEHVGRLAVRVEQASDPIMIEDRVVLFAQRAGLVVETLAARLPPVVVVGCDADPDRGGVDTLAMEPADYDAEDIARFRALRRELRSALRHGDVARLGAVATTSAAINQRWLAKPAFEFLLGLARRCGAEGVQVAHSGTVAGLMFDARRPGIERLVERCLDGLARAGLAVTTIVHAPHRPTPLPGRTGPLVGSREC